MNFKHMALAGAMALASCGVFAAPGDSFTSDFGSSTGAAGTIDSTFTFFTGLGSGLQDWELGVVATGLIALTSVTIDGTPVAIGPGPKLALGSGTFFNTDDLVAVHVVGTTTGKGSFGGSVTLTSVIPEPESYALMLAGLGVLGFVAHRRSTTQV